jgi:hypothetical protein
MDKIMQSLVNFLVTGPKLEGANIRGFTQSQLEQMGILKPTLKKAVKMGYITKTSVCKYHPVTKKPMSGMVNFYGVDLNKDLGERPETKFEEKKELSNEQTL